MKIVLSIELDQFEVKKLLWIQILYCINNYYVNVIVNLNTPCDQTS